ncbi:MAG: hypothetical protein J7K65_09655 [Planctomycetes bacterium]|nr:hypothetical protein [Planctomycetota bacterium]
MKKRWLILIAVIVIPICWIVLSRFYYQTEFNRRVEALAAEDYPVSLDELEAQYKLPQGVENAADIYIQAFEAYQDPNEFEREFLPIRGNFRWSDDVPPFPQEVMDAMESSLKANQKMLELLDKAAEIEHCLWPRKFEDMEDFYFPKDYLSGIKKATRLLCERDLYCVQKGDTGQLMNHFETLKALPACLSKQPFSTDYLMSIALKSMIARNLEEILNQVEFSDADLKELQRQFLEMQDAKDFCNMVVNARCVAINGYRLPLRERYKYFMADSCSNLTRFFYLFFGIDQKDKLLSLDFYDQLLQAAELPPHQLPSMIEKIGREFGAYSDFHLYLSDFRALGKVSLISLRALGGLRCAETALAIERYRLKYQSLPDSLEQLVPEFMAEVPREPFDGKVLRYIKHDVGYTVYTIGSDGVDNGGLSIQQMREKTPEGNPKEYDRPFTVRR